MQTLCLNLFPDSCMERTASVFWKTRRRLRTYVHSTQLLESKRLMNNLMRFLKSVISPHASRGEDSRGAKSHAVTARSFFEKTRWVMV